MKFKWPGPADHEKDLILIEDKIGDAHFNITKMNAAIWTGNYPRIPFSEDLANIKNTMKYLVKKGYAIESKGPRGGLGWTITESGILRAKKVKELNAKKWQLKMVKLKGYS